MPLTSRLQHLTDGTMALAHYPYLDLTVLPQLRGQIVSAQAAIVFTPNLSDILWLNADGVHLAGAESISAALSGDYRLDPVVKRQLQAAAESLTDAERTRTSLRLRRGFKTQVLGCQLQKLTLPDGKTAVLVLSDRMHKRSYGEADMAKAAVDALGSYSKASAVLGWDALILASDTAFDAMAVSADQLRLLIKDVADEEDRLIKRPLETSKGVVAMGLARLDDDPALHLLVTADAQSATASALASSTSTSSQPGTSGTALQAAEPSTSDTEPRSVGSFSNRRSGQAKGGISRWYYKQEPADPVLPEVEPVTPSELPPNMEKISTPGGEDGLREAGATDVTLSASAGEDGRSQITSGDESGFRFKASAKPVRFVWQMDTDGVFEEVSDELGATVGPQASNLEGRKWDEVVETLGFSNGETISKLLSTGDTWSGKTVMWPVERADLRVPVDLAGIPMFDAGRNFEGYSGFGIIRTADAVVDPDGGGLNLFSETTSPSDGDDTVKDVVDTSGDEKVVDFETRKSGRPDRELSSGEQTAFKEIAQKLTDAKLETRSRGTERNQSTSSEGVSDFTPSAFAKQRDANGQSGADTTFEVEANPVDTSILARLPIPVLVYRENDMLFGNREFFDLTGYADLSELTRRGGVSALFKLQMGEAESDGAMIYHRDGHPLDVRAQLQHVPWDTSRAMLLTLRRGGGGGKKQRQPVSPADTVSGSATQAANGSPLPSALGPKAGDRRAAPSSTAAASAKSSRRRSDNVVTAPIRQRVEKTPDNVTPLRPTESRSATQNDNKATSTSGTPKKKGASQALSAAKQAPERTAEKAASKHSSAKASKDETSTEAKSDKDAAKAKSTKVKSGDAAKAVTPRSFGGLSGDDMRGILDVATDGIVILSSQGTVLGLNRSAEALFDVAPNRVEGATFTELLAPESHRIATDYILSVTSPGVASLLNDGREIIGKNSQGGLIPIFMTIGKLDTPDTCCAVLRDITHFKKAEEELLAAKGEAESANALKSDFLAKISHELRTPLNAVIGFSDVMIAERFGRIENDRYRGYLRDIRRSGMHLLELVNDLLDISKIEAGKVELEFDACSLNLIISDAVSMMQPVANEDQVIIRTSLSAMVPKVVADPRSIRQVVLNIVSNAIKFTKEGGQVIISTVYDENGEVVLRIRDDGIGMSEKQLASAMKPFQQVEPPSRSQKSGTGLGLPLTKALVEANRARFSIESEPGHGTMVEIHFPMQRVLADS